MCDSKKTNASLESQTFFTKWASRSLILLLLIAASAWLDRIKDRWYVFDPAELNVLAQAAITSSPNDTAGMIQHIVTNLTSTYPANHVKINVNASDITEYLSIFGTPLGTEGHTGMHPADDDFNILVGEQWAFSPGQLEMEQYTPDMVHYLPRGAAKQYKMHEGCFALEYARGWIPLMMPFGFVDTFTSTLDFVMLYRTIKVTLREMSRNLFVGKI
ncbi:ERG2/sigma1 receptor-like protein [Mycena maculata]|uniref:C-8 sterol isomerase n=1 Tax=Mycena maculata TaxID=230809 RepID=A0AAD7IES8_9AGAR|nr:ERG2/sigma1 receptor-like protein [Mycena maculata]